MLNLNEKKRGNLINSTTKRRALPGTGQFALSKNACQQECRLGYMIPVKRLL